MVEGAVKQPAGTGPDAPAGGGMRRGDATALPMLAACVAGFTAVMLALLWARTLDVAYLAASATAAIAALLLVRRADASHPGALRLRPPGASSRR